MKFFKVFSDVLNIFFLRKNLFFVDSGILDEFLNVVGFEKYGGDIV